MSAYRNGVGFDSKENGHGGTKACLDLLLSRRDALKLGAAVAASCGVAHSHQGIIGSDLRPPGSAELKNEARGPMGELPPVFQRRNGAARSPARGRIPWRRRRRPTVGFPRGKNNRNWPTPPRDRITRPRTRSARGPGCPAVRGWPAGGADPHGQLPVQHAEGKTDAVPAEVAEATVGLQLAVGANVALEELRRREKGELGDDPPDLANALAVVHDRADRPPLAVHEHHPVHELDAVATAGGKDFLHVACRGGNGLFGQHVLSGLRRPDQPRLADTGRQGNIHGIHRVAGQ